MSARTVSLVLIAVVIACPIWCGAGLCYSGQFCSAESCGSEEQQCEHEVGPVQTTARSCCNESGQDNHDRAPRRCPKRSCQGVCGGAVFEEPSELNEYQTEFFPPLVDTARSVISLLAHFRPNSIEHPRRDCGANHGRCVRMLHMSFLC